MPTFLSRFFSLLLLITAFVTQFVAQFTLTPTDSLVVSVPADSTITLLKIDAINESSDSLAFTWRSIESNFPQGWEVNLCDLGECYSGIPTSATMISAAPGSSGYLKLVVNPLQISGHGFWHFWIYPAGDLDAKKDMYFVLDVVTVGIEESLDWTSGHWSPNPTRGKASWTGTGAADVRVKLFEMDGRYLGTERLQGGSLNLKPFQNGAPRMLIVVREIDNSRNAYSNVQRLLLLPSER